MIALAHHGDEGGIPKALIKPLRTQNQVVVDHDVIGCAKKSACTIARHARFMCRYLVRQTLTGFENMVVPPRRVA